MHEHAFTINWQYEQLVWTKLFLFEHILVSCKWHFRLFKFSFDNQNRMIAFLILSLNSLFVFLECSLLGNNNNAVSRMNILDLLMNDKMLIVSAFCHKVKP